jgi:hypothetical protein
VKTGSALFALACLLSACGSGGICNRSQGVWSEVSKKAAPCGVQAYQFSPSTCDEDVGKCTDQDLDGINAYYDCLDQLPSCDPNGLETWDATFGGCRVPQMTNSTCKAAWFPPNA